MWKTAPITLYLPYSQLMMAALALPPQPERVLILGHGGGSLAKWLAYHWPDLEVDAVEVDPSVVRTAETYFGYQSPRNHHIYVKDARLFVRTTARDYDIIWLDVFARHLIPFHLTTREFFTALREHLRPNGVLAVNLASSGEKPDSQRAYAVAETLRTIFPLIEAFGVKSPWQSSQMEAENLVFFAGASVGAMRQPDFPVRISTLAAQRRMPLEVAALIAYGRKTGWPRGVVLTDDYAPYDLLMGQGGVDVGLR
jgi:spermidine synthase